MKSYKMLLTLLLLTVFAVSGSANLFAQDKPDSSKMMNHKMNMQNDTGHKMDSGKMMKMKQDGKEQMKGEKDPRIRTGVIDVKSIDKNKEGMVYQDMMDWNVISDKPGKCPLCGMKLKKVSVDAAKTKLNEKGFKTK